MYDVLNLTKLNFNACIYGDGLPVTLRFADAVGEILTAGPERKGHDCFPVEIALEIVHCRVGPGAPPHFFSPASVLYLIASALSV